MIPGDAATDNWFQMDACLRGPDLAQQEAQISAMLSTIQIANGDLPRRPRRRHLRLVAHRPR
jgi:hypothetical protein